MKLALLDRQMFAALSDLVIAHHVWRDRVAAELKTSRQLGLSSLPIVFGDMARWCSHGTLLRRRPPR